MKKLNIFLAGLALLLSACSVNDFDGNIPEDNNEDMVDVTLSVSLEDFVNGSTRAGEEGSTLEDLSKIDMLVYAVRDDKGVVLSQYGKGVVDAALLDKPALKDRYEVLNDHNQTVMSADFSGGKCVDITLRVMRGTVFNLSLWAQSSQCTAYDFSDLTKVRVDYNSIKPNSDLYDAFFASSDFSIGQVETTLNVTMTRPFAQINVGINPDEFEEGQNAEGYKYVKLYLQGVANYFNVVERRVLTQEDVDNWDVSEEGDVSVATATQDLTTDWIDFSLLGTREVKEWEDLGDGTVKLQPHIYNNLGMFYVLVPDVEYNIEGGQLTETNVKGLKELKISISKDNESEEKLIYSGKQVPVTRNWRTNILFKNLNKAFGIIPKLSLEHIEDLTINQTWYPFDLPDKVTIIIPNQTDPDFLSNEYTYAVEFIKSDGISKDLEVIYNNVTGNFSFQIDLSLLEDIRKGAQIKITADYTQEFKDSYDVPEGTARKEITSVKWAKKPTYTWNFTGGAEDNLNGKGFFTNLTSPFSDSEGKSFPEAEDNQYFGLHAYSTAGRQITKGSNNIAFQGGGWNCNLYFQLYSSSKITISSTTNDNDRPLIIDYNVKDYLGDNKTPNGVSEAIANLINTSNGVYLNGFFMNLAKNIGTNGGIVYMNNIRENHIVYIYSGNKGINIQSITLSCVDYEPTVSN